MKGGRRSGRASDRRRHQHDAGRACDGLLERTRHLRALSGRRREPLAVRRGDPGAGPVARHRQARRGRSGRRRRRRLGGRRPRARHDLRPRQEHHQRRPPPGHPGRHRQDPRLAAAGLHQDRDRRPRPAQPERLPDQGPAAGGQGSRPDPRRGRGGRRPVPPDAPITRSSGTASRTSCTPGSTSTRSSTGCRPSSARRSTGRSSRSPPAASPIRWPRPGARSARSRTSARSPSSARARYPIGRLGRLRRVEPRLLGQRVPALALAHASDRRRHPRRCPTARKSP